MSPLKKNWSYPNIYCIKFKGNPPKTTVVTPKNGLCKL